jgi:urease accessory protein
MRRVSKAFLGTASLAILMAGRPALAHHVMGGQTPATAWQGFLSGLGHPIIGADHLAMVVAVGLLARIAGPGLLLPSLFIAGTIIGCLAHVQGLSLPFSELAITFTLCAAAVMVAMRLQMRTVGLAVLFAVAGIVHGYAYGESIVGAEPAPLVAYVAGFAVVQYGIAIAAAAAMRSIVGPYPLSESTVSKAAGGVIALVAVVSLVNSVIGV